MKLLHGPIHEITIGNIPMGMVFEGCLCKVRGVMMRTTDGVMWLPSGIVPKDTRGPFEWSQVITQYRPYPDAELILK